MIYSRKELQATILGLKPLFNPLFRFSGLSFTPYSNEAIPGILPGNALKAFVTSLIWSDVAPALYLKATICFMVSLSFRRRALAKCCSGQKFSNRPSRLMAGETLDFNVRPKWLEAKRFETSDPG